MWSWCRSRRASRSSPPAWIRPRPWRSRASSKYRGHPRFQGPPPFAGGFFFRYSHRPVMDAKFLQTLMDALAVGSLYALIALGYTMVYGILKFINFAHSDIFVLGAWVSFSVAAVAGFTEPQRPVAGWVFVVLAGVCAAAVLSGV